MNKIVKTPDLPYVARTYWFFRWGFLLTYLSFMAGFAFNYTETIESLAHSSWLVNIVIFITFLVWFPIVAITSFFSKTVFGETYIENTSQLLIKKKWRYEDIEKVETSNTGHIRVTFADGNSIKVWRGETRLDYVLSILKSKNVDSQIYIRQIRRNI